jgi:dTDP-4-amino-4,6-dideoxygalactose transaminase
LTLPVADEPRAFHIFNQYVIRTGDRDALRAHLTGAGIGTEIYYPVPFHVQPCFSSLGYEAGAFPVAEAAAADSLALPIFGELTESQQQHVVQSIVRFYC